MTELQNTPATPSNSEALQKAIFTRGTEIFRMTEEQSTGSIFNKDWWYGRIMDWSMKNEQFKVQMFRFVDVLPYLNSSDEVARHLKEYFTGDGQEMPSVLGWGLGLGALAPGLMASAIRKNVTQMARMFITGSGPDEAFKNLEKMRKEKLCFTVDILGEAAVSEEEAASYQRRYLELIETLAKRAEKWPEIEQIDRDHAGPISKVNVSVKVSSLYSQLDPIDPENSIRVVKEKLRPIFRRARELGVFINLDMESYLHKDLTLALFKSLMDEPEFADHGNVGIVIQAYLRDSENDLRSLINWAKKRPGRLTVRLVKGAYWDYETVLAKQRGWPVPVFTNKKETDANYETLSLIMLENEKTIKAAFGSHNIRSIAFALAQADRLGIDRRSFEIQMLYGMADQIKAALVKQGLRLREYAPVGELIPGMAYLVRRLLENTSNESFLRAKFSSNASNEELLSDPRLKIPTVKTAMNNGNGTGSGDGSLNGAGAGYENGKANTARKPLVNDASVAAYQMRGFQNEPPLDFNNADTRRAMHDALAAVRKKFDRHFPLVIGKKEIKTAHEAVSHNPADPSIVIGKVAMASSKEAELALETAHKAQKDWSRLPADMRAIYLERIAQTMRRRKFELAAVEIFEVGKTWREADGDIAEAIDFCMYYARHMRALDKGMKTSFVPGEESIYKYQARGVGVVIAPWNFPLAILTGMTVGAAVCGNAVIMKPAEQSPIIAGYFMDILKEVGLPDGVINFLPGLGEEVGDYLVRHPKTDFVIFTGSKEVGLHIIEAAAKTTKGQRSVKRVVAEMGGKNAIIVDSDADLDEAVIGTLHSAFGFQGQKCSACSRLIVLEENYDKFIHRLIEGARSLTLGNPENPGTAVGPVIDKESYERILKRIEQGKTEAKLAFQSELPANTAQGYFVPPTIFVDVPPHSSLAQNEIFGPVIAVMKAKNFEEALAIANDTEFALTGGVYSRSPANLEKAKHEFDVGNLYINRGITGAMVGRHPFGGYKMSGVGSKAGGPDYLLQFMEPRAVTENTMRRGFAPNNEIPEEI